MEEKVFTKNCVADLAGIIITEPTFSHSVKDEQFYMFSLAVNRNSGATDEIPVIASERLFPYGFEKILGEKVYICGEVRTFNKELENKNRLLVFIFATEISRCETEPTLNCIEIFGNLCKEPVFRKTPMGKDITELLIAVNRPRHQSDYIPCICWGSMAEYASKLNVGDKVFAKGRFQSRNYKKKIAEEHFIEKVAYEVSLSQIYEVEDF